MAINAVGSPVTALQQQVAAERQPEARAPEQPRQNTDTAARAREANEARDVERAQSQSAQRQSRPEQAERPEPPRPVVNAQGQKTGTIISTTA